MKAASILILLFIVRPAGDGPASGDSYAVHLLNGDRYYHAFDNTRALAEYQRAYQMAPDSFETLLRLVNVYNDIGRLKLRKDDSSEVYYRMSLEYADSLVRHFPNRAESHFWLALCEGSLIPFLGVKPKIATSRKVVEEANRAIQIDSGFALAYTVLGIFQRQASRINWFERMLANVVFGANFSGSLTASETLLRKSILLDPSNSYGYYELYWTYRAMQDSVRAVQSLRTLLTIAPTNSREQLQAEDAKRQLALFGRNP